MEKPLETAWVGLKVGWGRASGNHQCAANSVSQVDGASDVALTCQLSDFLGGGLRKQTVASANAMTGRKLLPMPDNSVPHRMSLMPSNLLPQW